MNNSNLFFLFLLMLLFVIVWGKLNKDMKMNGASPMKLHKGFQLVTQKNALRFILQGQYISINFLTVAPLHNFHYFSISSIFLSLDIFPLASSIRISLASFKNSEAKIKSFSRWLSEKIISLLLPLHSFWPWYM